MSGCPKEAARLLLSAKGPPAPSTSLSGRSTKVEHFIENEINFAFAWPFNHSNCKSSLHLPLPAVMTAHSPKGKERETASPSSLPTSKKGIHAAMEVDGEGASHTRLPWVEKYRPMALADVISHGDIISTCTRTSLPPSQQLSCPVVRRFVREGKLPHLLFYGPPGTGKTSTACSLANEIFGRERPSMVLELNASDERGIGVVREQIKSFAATRTLSLSPTASTVASFKLIILDECDAMTSAAQNALRRGTWWRQNLLTHPNHPTDAVMEKYVKNVRFILICNYVGQMIPALQSRCTRFRFAPIPAPALGERLAKVAQAEGLAISDAAREAVTRLAGGDMRRILNVLQAAASAVTEGGPQVISDDLIYAVTATPHPADLDRIFQTLLTQTDLAAAVSLVRQLQVARGLATVDIVRAMFERLARVQPGGEEMRIGLTRLLADIEYRLAKGATEQIQLVAMCGAFIASRARLVL